jgi:hypothetical protein
MAGLRWSPALISLALFAAAAPAQGIAVNGGSFSYSHGKSSRSLSLSVGGVYGYGYGLSRYYSAFSGPRVTVISSGPQIVVVPVVLLPRPSDWPGDAPDTAPRRIPERPRDLPDDQPPAAALPAPLPGQNAGVFHPLDPDNRERARRPVEPELPPAGPLPPAVPEGATLVERGRAAFAAGQYGRAADHFRRAATDAANPVPSFLLIQTLIALDKYSTAAETAAAAVERFPGWTALTVRPLDLYAEQAANYASDLKRLEETRAAHPDDPVLLFLAGHTLWFDGRKDEARTLFRRAAPAIPAAVRFLQPQPPTML